MASAHQPVARCGWFATRAANSSSKLLRTRRLSCVPRTGRERPHAADQPDQRLDAAPTTRQAEFGQPAQIIGDAESRQPGARQRSGRLASLGLISLRRSHSPETSTIIRLTPLFVVVFGDEKSWGTLAPERERQRRTRESESRAASSLTVEAEHGCRVILGLWRRSVVERGGRNPMRMP